MYYSRKTKLIVPLLLITHINTLPCMECSTQDTQQIHITHLPNEILSKIASYLSWKEIGAASNTCKDLNHRFTNPQKKIILNYSKRRKGRQPTRPLFEKLFATLQTIHNNPKNWSNPTTIILRENTFSEAFAFRSLESFFTRLNKCNLNHNITMVDLSLNNLCQAPDSLPTCQNLKKLSYFENRPTDFTRFSIADFPKLTKLGLSIYQDQNLELYKWTQLQKLYLDLKSFEPNSELFRQVGILRNLKTVNLCGSHCDLRSWFNNAVVQILKTKLQSDDVKKICHLPNLQNLTLRNLQAENLIPQLTNLTKLKKLELNPIEILSEQSAYTNDDKLELTINGQTRRFPYSTNKRTVITEDQLNEICHSLANAEQLEIADFSNNKLHSIPRSIALLHRLKKLSFYNNKLQSLPQEIVQLTNLQELNIAFYPTLDEIYPGLEFSPELLTNLPSLRYLYLLSTPSPLTNDLPFIQKLVHLRQQLSEKAEALKSLKQNLCVFDLKIIFLLLEPEIINRLLLIQQYPIIKFITEQNEHPIIALRKLFEYFKRQKENIEHPPSERPKKRQKTE